MKLTESQINQAIKDGREALANNPNKKIALVYPLGFKPNAYRWDAPAERVRVTMTDFRIEPYDQKRSYGRGSYITLWRY